MFDPLSQIHAYVVEEFLCLGITVWWCVADDEEREQLAKEISKDWSSGNFSFGCCLVLGHSFHRVKANPIINCSF